MFFQGHKGGNSFTDERVGLIFFFFFEKVSWALERWPNREHLLVLQGTWVWFLAKHGSSLESNSNSRCSSPSWLSWAPGMYRIYM